LKGGGSKTAVGEISSVVPSTVASGQYQLRIIIKPEGGEWRIITDFTGNTPTSVDFTMPISGEILNTILPLCLKR